MLTHEQLRMTARTPESDGYLPAEDTGLTVLTEYVSGSGLCSDPVQVRITCGNNGSSVWLGVLRVELVAEGKDPGFFLPGYFYGHNTGDLPDSGRKPFPRIRPGKTGKPFSDRWMTRADRLALPVAVMEENGMARGISASPWWAVREGRKVPAQPGEDPETLYRFSGFTFAARDGGADRVSVGYTLGYENAPWLFVQTATVLDRAPLEGDRCFCLEPGERVSFPVWLYEYAISERTEILAILEDTYVRFHEPPRTIPGMTVRKAAEAVARAVDGEAWLEQEQMYTGFVYDRPGGKYENRIGSLSWTNGLTVAVPQLTAGLRLRDEGMRERALTFIRNALENSMNPCSGLPFEAVADGKWSNRGWWYDGMHTPGHSGYLQGQAVYYLLRAYQAEMTLHGTEHTDWLDRARQVQDVLDRAVNVDGEYPFVLSEETGAGLEYLSLGSCWCLASAVYLGFLTGDHSGLARWKKSEQRYYDRYVAKLECFGGPLDTDKAVDSESNLAYLRAVRWLHVITGDKVFLEHMRIALGYECSFKLGWNTPVRVPPLRTVGWSSCGGTITSVANPHIHPMSSTIVDEMLYYVRETGDEYFRSRLTDTVNWGLQTFNTVEKEYGYGGVGWMSERFCFCEGLLTERYPDGSPASTWFALMPWAACSVTEGLLGDLWDGKAGIG